VAERKPFLLRIDADLYAALARWADDEMRSLNGQIEFLLRRALAGAGRLSTSMSTPPLGVPAQGRLKSAAVQPAATQSTAAPPAPRSDDRAPEARPSAGWDAMED
jgi:hypothetical protein